MLRKLGKTTWGRSHRSYGRIWKLTLFAIGVLGLLLVSGCNDGARNSSLVAPDFRLASLDGNTLSLSELRGRPVLVNFWATWCGPCRAEMPILEKVHRDKASEGLVILGVDVGEDERTVRAFVRDFQLSFPVLLDRAQKVTEQYRILGIPTSFLIDRNGIIRFVKVGPFYGEWELLSALERIQVGATQQRLYPEGLAQGPPRLQSGW
ncbi:MAG: TlpA family protein disulfide reductase [Chloroflexi bacterium]|nr:TlpA family protein disulfide reductase [Chloroflexota bacterium]